MTQAEASAVYQAEKAKRAARTQAQLDRAAAIIARLDAEREARQLGCRRRGRRPHVAALTKRDRDVIREAQLDTQTWEKFTR